MLLLAFALVMPLVLVVLSTQLIEQHFGSRQHDLRPCPPAALPARPPPSPRATRSHRQPTRASPPCLPNSEATESLALWRGVEAAADARGLLQLCGSVDIAPVRGSSAASEALGALQDASQVLGCWTQPERAEGCCGGGGGGGGGPEVTAACMRACSDAAACCEGVLPLGACCRPPPLAPKPPRTQAAGLQFGMLSPDEVSASFPRLRPPAGSAALYTPAGGVVQGRLAADVLRAMALRAGADVAPRGKQQCLLGWRDAGGHFVLRAASASAAAAAAAAAPRAAAAAAAAAADEEVIWEVEQLVLLPDAAVQQQSLAAFGLALPGAALWHVPAGRWSAQEDCAAVPVWQLLGTNSTRGVDDPTALDSCWGTPVLGWAPGGLLVAHSLANGQPAANAGGGEAAAAGDGQSAGGGESELDLALQQAAAGGDLVEAAAAAAMAADPELDERLGSEEAIDAQLARLTGEQAQRESAQRRLATAGGLAARLVNGVGGRLTGPGGQSLGLQLAVVVTPDGEPAVGSHPGFEAGRVVVGVPGAAAALGCLPGGQLAPLLGQLAAGEALGEAPQVSRGTRLGGRRGSVQKGANTSWRELLEWLQLGQQPTGGPHDRRLPRPCRR